ncbi:hypothetical protein GJ744_004570 [Endocarpon pusillum]|uniref:Uncharacterized protein n=1 Tax=Endocarpon pusillum TaxID=364733 RepID=A0A8H7AQK7_9EURO|nr:hypothetical protein GJ744_004570 [Endocarpon pusillum]
MISSSHETTPIEAENLNNPSGIPFRADATMLDETAPASMEEVLAFGEDQENVHLGNDTSEMSNLYENQTWEEYEAMTRSDFFKSLPAHLRLRVQCLLDRPILDDHDPLLSDGFWVFADEEVRTWADEYGDTHGPQPIEYLVEPTGRGFVDHGDNVLTADRYCRRQSVNSDKERRMGKLPMDNWPEDVRALHEDFSKWLVRASDAKVLVYVGQQNKMFFFRTQMREWKGSFYEGQFTSQNVSLKYWIQFGADGYETEDSFEHLRFQPKYIGNSLAQIISDLIKAKGNAASVEVHAKKRARDEEKHECYEGIWTKLRNNRTNHPKAHLWRHDNKGLKDDNDCPMASILKDQSSYREPVRCI